MRVLLLGGTTEATALASALKTAGIETVLSYAGRTKAPATQPVETRIGGFGGSDGLMSYLATAGFTHLIDATHPFAAQMSRNAHAACSAMNLPMIRMERPAWQAQDGDNWVHVCSLEEAAERLPTNPTAVFLAIGRQHVGIFSKRPEHHYLLRFVDAPAEKSLLPKSDIVVAKGPFSVANDTELLREHGITHVVTKNAGGRGAEAKLIAARKLGLQVIIVDRPELPDCLVSPDIETVLHWLTPRGV